MWWEDYKKVTFGSIKGKTLAKICIDKEKARIYFLFDDGSKYKMSMENDCCNAYWLDDICGELRDLIGSPLIEAEEVTNMEKPPVPVEAQEHYTWTFYKLGTIKGSVTLRWFGTSNGYYSESVYFEKYVRKEE